MDNVFFSVRVLLLGLQVEDQLPLVFILNFAQNLSIVERVEPAFRHLIFELELGHVQALADDVVVADVVPDVVDQPLLFLLLLQGLLVLDLFDIAFDQLFLGQPIDLIQHLLLQLLLRQLLLLFSRQVLAGTLGLFLLPFDDYSINLASFIVFDVYAVF